MTMTSKDYANARVKEIFGETERIKAPEGVLVPNTNGMYIVTREGLIFSLYKGKYIGQHKSSIGYLKATLVIGGAKKAKFIHRIVAEAYIPNPNRKSDVNHIDGNKLNNSADNLEWVSRAENIQHAWALGLCKTSDKARKASSQNGKATAKRVAQYDKQGTLIATHESQTVASQVTGIGQSTISDCCRGKQKTSGGYVWKYVE